jgi:hypothetical protein
MSKFILMSFVLVGAMMSAGCKGTLWDEEIWRADGVDTTGSEVEQPQKPENTHE